MKRTDSVLLLRPILLARRDRLRRSLDDELSLLSHPDDDESYEDDVFSRLSLSESRELSAIDVALQRMREGTYGVCDECERHISLARLQALPYATTCIRCQQESEGTSPSRAIRQPALA